MNDMQSLNLRKYRISTLLFCIGIILSLNGCGGAETQALPNKNIQASTGVAVVYTGPAPQTSDIQAFKLNVWDKLAQTNRCGNCHGVDGPGTPAFTRNDDINLAYALINGLIDTTTPSNSRIVTKVGGGHNCWLSQSSACAVILTAYIENWVNSSISSLNGNQIQLIEPTIKSPGTSKNFPQFAALSGPQMTALINLQNVLKTNCSQCHVADSTESQAPYFASSDLATAYQAMQLKVDLDNPALSRIVVRLGSEFHNCWGDCQANATELKTLIQALSAQIALTAVDPALLASKALRLHDGTVASGGARVENNVIALYEFKTGTGKTVFDSSGVTPELHLTMTGNNITWLSGWGINIKSGRVQGLSAPSKKIHDLIQATGEYSIESWVVPANVTQEGPASIISYSGGSATRNFTLGQTLYNYELLQRSSASTAAGMPSLSTANADEDLQASLQHVVATFDPVNGRKIYVNGVFTDDVDSVTNASLSGWDDTFVLSLGDEPSQNKQWQGQIRLLAIHNRALSAAQIKQNFDSGVGEKYFLLFSISDLINVPKSYIVFEVSQFDEFSYLFNQPKFINLDPNYQVSDFAIEGIRIGMNGQLVDVGQAFTSVKQTITANNYDAINGQLLSPLGTVIALEKGVNLDEFFLTFDRIGNLSNAYTEPPLPAAVPPTNVPRPSDIGLKLFDEVNATLASATGVNTAQTSVKNVFTQIKQQLPVTESINGFLASQQMAVSQLAIEYCSALVDGNGSIATASYFPAFSFTTAKTAFDTSVKRNALFDPLIEHIYPKDSSNIITPLTSQPTVLEVKTELNNLVDRLSQCAIGSSPTCNTVARTQNIVKASCAALFGSAVMLIQ